MTILSLFVDDKISRPMNFVSLNDDGSEGLIIAEYSKSRSWSYKFIDPFLPSDAINVSYFTKIITKSNKKIFIFENKVHVTDGLNGDTFKQMLKKTTYHSNIYTF